jgi:hypothetical protein
MYHKGLVQSFWQVKLKRDAPSVSFLARREHLVGCGWCASVSRLYEFLFRLCRYAFPVNFAWRGIYGIGKKVLTPAAMLGHPGCLIRVFSVCLGNLLQGQGSTRIWTRALMESLAGIGKERPCASLPAPPKVVAPYRGAAVERRRLSHSLSLPAHKCVVWGQEVTVRSSLLTVASCKQVLVCSAV